MRAIYVQDNQPQYSSGFPAPARDTDEILLQVKRAGICDTDLQIIRGYMGFTGVLGHEFVATATSGRYQGQRVVAEINCQCGKCSICERGMGNHCPTRTVIGILNHPGGFADYVTAPEANLHPIPSSISDDEAVFVEPIAAAFEISEQIKLETGLSTLVLGDGKLGNLIAQVLNLQGCQVTVAGRHTNKLAILDRLGINTCLIDNLGVTRSFDLVVDCTGSITGLPTALKFIRPRGTIVLKTTVADPLTMNMAQIVIDEISLIGSRCGPFRPAIKALEEKAVFVAPLIQDEYPLDKGLDALAAASQKGSTKVLLNME